MQQMSPSSPMESKAEEALELDLSALRKREEANRAELNKDVTQIILIGDEPPNSSQITGRQEKEEKEALAAIAAKCREDLKKEFGLTDDEIQHMIDDKCTYESLSAKREELFAKRYAEMVKETEQSRKLLQDLPDFKPGDNPEKLIAALQSLKKASETTSKARISRTLVLIDATGSMGSTIDGVKGTITTVVRNINTVLAANHIDKNVLMKIAVYRNYAQEPGEIFQCSGWSSDPHELQRFINTIHASGGFAHYAPEAAEVGLCHAMGEDVTQIMIFADQPPNEKHMIPALVNHKGEALAERHKAQFYGQFKDADTLAGEFAKKKVPIHGFYVSPNARSGLSRIATMTGGKCEFLNTDNRYAAAAGLYRILGNTVLTDVAGGDNARAQELLWQYNRL